MFQASSSGGEAEGRRRRGDEDAGIRLQLHHDHHSPTDPPGPLRRRKGRSGAWAGPSSTVWVKGGPLICCLGQGRAPHLLVRGVGGPLICCLGQGRAPHLLVRGVGGALICCLGQGRAPHLLVRGVGGALICCLGQGRARHLLFGSRTGPSSAGPGRGRGPHLLFGSRTGPSSAGPGHGRGPHLLVRGQGGAPGAVWSALASLHERTCLAAPSHNSHVFHLPDSNMLVGSCSLNHSVRIARETQLCPGSLRIRCWLESVMSEQGEF